MKHMQMASQPLMHRKSSRLTVLLCFVVFVLCEQQAYSFPEAALKSSDGDPYTGPIPTEERNPREDSVVREEYACGVPEEQMLKDKTQKVPGLCEEVDGFQAVRARSNWLGEELLDPRLGHL